MENKRQLYQENTSEIQAWDRIIPGIATEYGNKRLFQNDIYRDQTQDPPNINKTLPYPLSDQTVQRFADAFINISQVEKQINKIVLTSVSPSQRQYIKQLKTYIKETRIKLKEMVDLLDKLGT